MDESILFFLEDFSLNILSRSSLHFVGIRGIYTGVRIKCEESGFSKQSWLVTWPCDLIESSSSYKQIELPDWTFCPVVL